MNKEIFREYDIRGILGKDLDLAHVDRMRDNLWNKTTQEPLRIQAGAG